MGIQVSRLIPAAVHKKHQFVIVDSFLSELLLRTLSPLAERIRAIDDLLVVVPEAIIFMQM